MFVAPSGNSISTDQATHVIKIVITYKLVYSGTCMTRHSLGYDTQWITQYILH